MPSKRLQMLVLLFSGILYVAGNVIAQPSLHGRIYDGEDVAIQQTPWAVSVRRNNAHICGGTIISNTKILTAGHCVSKLGTTPVAPSEISVRVGSVNQFAGGKIININDIIIHDSYGNFLHNLALLNTSTPLTFTDRINKIELPQIDEQNDGELANGTAVHVQGWGELANGLASYKLQNGNFTTLSSQLCELQAGYGYNSVLCLQRPEEQGVCRGDAGASVVSEDKTLVGVVSFFFGDCGTRYPDISSKVAYYLEWIKKNS